MFIDYVTLMLINTSAALVILAAYVYSGVGAPDQRKWAPALAVPALISLVLGLHMSTTWPLPGSYNAAYGDISILFGGLLAGAALALAFGWSLFPLTIYAFFAGAAAVLIGVRFIDLNLSLQPVFTGIGFIITGLCGIFAGPFLLRPIKALRVLGAGALVVAAVIWLITGYGAYWIHIQSLSKWVPPLMK
ncbi:MAG: DUF981 domain-containing protein [Armatimonadota bacterium]|nr:DUF981 domain-containing protein [bacterium]